MVRLIPCQTEAVRVREMSAVDESLASCDFGASQTGVNTEALGLVTVLSLLPHLDISSFLRREEVSLSRLLLCLRNEPGSRNHRTEGWKGPSSSLMLEFSSPRDEPPPLLPHPHCLKSEEFTPVERLEGKFWKTKPSHLALGMGQPAWYLLRRQG